MSNIKEPVHLTEKYRRDIQLSHQLFEDIAVIEIGGELNLFTRPFAVDYIQRLIQNKHFNIICDLQKLEYIDSAGLGFFPEALRQVCELSGDLKLARLNPLVMRLFKITNMEFFIDIYDDVDQALTDIRANIARAIFKWKKLLVLKPNYADAYHNLALAYLNSGMLDEARQEAEKALTINPQYADALVTMGIIFYKKRNFKDAREQFKQALDIDPEHLNALRMLAVTYDDDDMIDESIHRYQRAIQLYPGYADLHCHYGGVLLRKKNYKAAEEELLEASRLNPSYKSAYYQLADLKEKTSQPAKAIDFLTKLLGISTLPDEIEQIQQRISALKTKTGTETEALIPRKKNGSA